MRNGYAAVVTSAALVAPARSGRGQPTKLATISPKVRQEVLDRVKHGVPAGTAAVACGVHRRTFQRWLEEGRRDNAREPYRKFAADIEQAFMEWQASKVTEIDRHAEKDWRAGAWMLERLDPATYGDHLKGGGSTVNVQVTLEIERKQATDEIMAAARRALADDPDALARLLQELAAGAGAIVDGDAVEVLALDP